MRPVFFIVQRLLAFSTALSLFVSTSGVPLVYRFCGTDIETVRIALTASVEVCEMMQADKAQAVQSQQCPSHPCSDETPSASSCCHHEESSAQPSAVQARTNIIQDDVASSACCHEEFHISQLEATAVMLAVQPTFSPMSVAAVIPMATVLQTAHIPQSTLLHALAISPPPEQDIPIFTGALLI
jgi:hypothetical protein